LTAVDPRRYEHVVPTAPHTERERQDHRAHYQFGRNWRSFSQTVDDTTLDAAEQGLTELLDAEEWHAKTVLDIGCGSGVHVAAMRRLGAGPILSIDIDPICVETTRKLVSGDDQVTVVQDNILALQHVSGTFDIVYSWGVLHHTGALWEAVAAAAEHVKPGGHLIIAIYVKTPFCTLWRMEKRLFTKLPETVQKAVGVAFSGAAIARMIVGGDNPITKIKSQGKRGMDWWFDKLDWLGGYPYESASAAEVTNCVEGFDFVTERTRRTQPSVGLFGSGCAEYVFKRR
jgi:2-polyprenyl-6-hydroxyphenyl methylase/3-demethylubiquinone-9 3-methyltransferase